MRKLLVILALVAVCVPLRAADDKPKEPSIIAVLGAELDAAHKQVAQLQVQLRAAQIQNEGLTRTLDTVLQADASKVSDAYGAEQKALFERLVKALGGDPAKQEFDPVAKALKTKTEAK